MHKTQMKTKDENHRKDVEELDRECHKYLDNEIKMKKAEFKANLKRTLGKIRWNLNSSIRQRNHSLLGLAN